MMELIIKKINNVVIFKPCGKVGTLLTASRDRKIINAIIENSDKNHDEQEVPIVINMEEIKFLTSSALQFFISLTKRKLELSKHKLTLCNMNSEIQNLFEVTSITDMFDIYNSEEEAINSMSRLLN